MSNEENKEKQTVDIPLQTSQKKLTVVLDRDYQVENLTKALGRGTD